METLTSVPQSVIQAAEQKPRFVEAPTTVPIEVPLFKPPFTPDSELAVKYAGSGDPLGSTTLSKNQLKEVPYAERRIAELRQFLDRP